MSAAVYETTSVKIMAGGNEFTMTASRLKFDGFMSVYIEADEKEEKNQILSKLEKGEELELADLVKCPALYPAAGPLYGGIACKRRWRNRASDVRVPTPDDHNDPLHAGMW